MLCAFCVLCQVCEKCDYVAFVISTYNGINVKYTQTHTISTWESFTFSRDISTRSSSSVIRHSAWLQQRTSHANYPQTIFPEFYSPEDFAGSSDCSAVVSWGGGSSLFLWKPPSPTRTLLLSMQNIKKRKVLNHLLMLETAWNSECLPWSSTLVLLVFVSVKSKQRPWLV